MNPDMPVWTNPLIFQVLMFVSFFLTITVDDIVEHYSKRNKKDRGDQD